VVVSTLPEPQPTTVAPAVAHLVERLVAMAEGRPDARYAMEEVAELEVAQEELRVAAEEMRVQQAQIRQLVSQYETERRWRGQLSSLVPLGLCTTDGAGKIVEANPALAAAFGVPLTRLRGKPLSVYLAPEDVRSFRSGVRALASGQAVEHHAAVRLRDRNDQAPAVEIFGFADVTAPLDSEARIQWVLVPQYASGPDEPPLPTGAAEATSTLGLAAALAELSTLPLEDDDRQRLLGRIAVLARGAVPSADWISLTVGPPAQPQLLASDSTEAQEFDGMQMRAAEGPCWEAYASRATVLTGDVTTDPRWPALLGLAGAGSVRSVLALPVLEAGAATGVLNVYAGKPDAFSAVGQRLGEVVAAAVTGILQRIAERQALKDLVANLETALTSRAVIDQAKGVLMARLGIDADEAFARLVGLSSRLNVKLRELAHLVVEGHADQVIAALRD
jgi:PAS domain S-box-containing protein